MRRKAVPTTLTLEGLKTCISNCGGQKWALEYALELLEKLRAFERRPEVYSSLLKGIRSARDQADLRGRLLEANLAYQLESAALLPQLCEGQGGSGDIDFAFDVGNYRVFLELKLLRRQAPKGKNEAGEKSEGSLKTKLDLDDSDDRWDVARISARYPGEGDDAQV